MRLVAAAVLVAGMAWGCTPRTPEGVDIDLPGIMMEGEEAGVTAPPLRPDPPVLGPEAPYIPVIHPPDVQRVWIPSRINAHGDLASGHWIYLKVRPAEWFLKRRNDSELSGMRLEMPRVPTIRSQEPEAGR